VHDVARFGGGRIFIFVIVWASVGTDGVAACDAEQRSHEQPTRSRAHISAACHADGTATAHAVSDTAKCWIIRRDGAPDNPD
jgi:hypothetical protein